jgi:hypothetical protein
MRIALFGVAGSGKDFLGSFLKEEREYSSFSFGSSLKEICCEIFDGVIFNPIDSDIVISKYGKSHREIWIRMAKTIREIDNEIFVRKTLEKIEKEEEKGDGKNIIITDLRDEVEYAMLAKQGFVFINVFPKDGRAVKPANEYDDKIKFLSTKNYHIFINDFDERKTLKRFGEFIDRISLVSLD